MTTFEQAVTRGMDEYLREDIPEDGLSEAQVVAVAVRDYLLSDEAVERAAKAILDGVGIEPEEDGTYWGGATWPNAVQDARAALSAALGKEKS